ALKMTTGDICGTGYAYTTPGRWITIEDSLGVNDWTDPTLPREGDYDHTGMICRGQNFRGSSSVSLGSMLLQAPCLQEMPFCQGDELSATTPDSAVFSVRVESDAS